MRSLCLHFRLASFMKRFPIAPDATRCSTCFLSDICLPVGMSQQDVALLDEFIQERVRVPKGVSLFELGDQADAIYGLRSGAMKTQLQDASGQVQITGFVLPGEIIGMDGMGGNTHVSNAIALEDSEVCLIRVQDIDRISPQLPVLQQQFRRLMGMEINRSHQMVMTLGTLRSEQRVAAFLLNISHRLSVLGYSSREFILRMSREEIGNYLGLTLETVSRLLSRFARENLIRIKQREVTILDMDALKALAGTECG